MAGAEGVRVPLGLPEPLPLPLPLLRALSHPAQTALAPLLPELCAVTVWVELRAALALALAHTEGAAGPCGAGSV